MLTQYGSGLSLFVCVPKLLSLAMFYWPMSTLHSHPRSNAVLQFGRLSFKQTSVMGIKLFLFFFFTSLPLFPMISGFVPFTKQQTKIFGTFQIATRSIFFSLFLYSFTSCKCRIFLFPPWQTNVARASFSDFKFFSPLSLETFITRENHLPIRTSRIEALLFDAFITASRQRSNQQSKFSGNNF